MLQLQQQPAPTDEELVPATGDDDRSMLSHRTLALIRGDFEERTWTAFWRTVVDGRFPRDVAEELQISVASVYQAKSRVLRRLREELPEEFS